MRSRIALFGIAVSVSFLMCACSSSTPPTIAITMAPPSSMEVNLTATIAATVTNDPSNSGVDWSCAPVNSCGTFTPAHTASGATTVYRAPGTSGSVTITAASTKKPTVTASANVTINPVGSTSNLTGTYTFIASGWDVSGNPASVVGSIVLDGTGKVTGGEQDYFDATAPDIFPQDTITGGTITIGSDGRGTLTPIAADLQANGITETFSIVLVNNKHLLITEFDGNVTSAGSMDLQTTPTSPTGGNAFALLDGWNYLVFGGVITSDGATVTDAEADADGLYPPFQDIDFSFNGDSIDPPDSYGRGQISLDGYEFAYYAVGPEAFRLIEIDGYTTDQFLAGSMYGQGAAAGAYSEASLQGPFVCGQGGLNDFGAYSFGAAGQFTATGDPGNPVFTSGVADVNFGDGSPVYAGDLVAGSSFATSYSIYSNGYGYISLDGTTTDGLANLGIYMVDPTINIADPNSTTGGGGALMTDLDLDSAGVGFVVPQATNPTFSGNYAFNQDGNYVTTIYHSFDLIGQTYSDGSSNLAGLVDFNDLDNTGQNAKVTLAGTFAADAANPGRSTAQLTVSGSPISPQNITIYQASRDLLLHVDTDSGTTEVVTGFGILQKQQ
jgi:hypothetical protein